MAISIEEFYQKNKVDADFDEVFYQNNYPATKDFYQPYCKENNIDDKHRLYFHYMMYGQNQTPSPYQHKYESTYEENYQTIKEKTDYTKIIQSFVYNPKISILLSCYNSNIEYLRLCIQSVIDQIYQNWELIIVDDGSNNDDLTSFLSKYQTQNDRIKLINLNTNVGISNATNIAIENSTGTYCQILDHDDILEKDCLFHVVANINEKPNSLWIYFDEQLIDQKNNPNAVIKKPSPDIFIQMSRPYMSTHAIFEINLLKKVGGFREAFEGCQDHDLGLRLLSCVDLDDILHIALPLYRWRQHKNSFSKNNISTWHSAGEKSIREFIELKYGLSANVKKRKDSPGFDIEWPINNNDKICLIILTHSKVDLLKNCINSILEKTSYNNYEILIVCNNATTEVMTYVQSIKNNTIRFVIDNRMFNWSALNNSASKMTDAKYIVFLNDDIEIITENWLEKMCSVCSLSEVGTVGAKLLFEDHTIQHIGVFCNDHLIPFHPQRMQSDRHISLFSHEDHCSLANTGACLMMSKQYLNELGRFNERLPEGYNDVDFGYRTIVDGKINITKVDAVLLHHETQTRSKDAPQKIWNKLATKYIVSHNDHKMLLSKQNINAFHIPVPVYTPNSYEPIKPIVAIVHIPKAAGSTIRQYYIDYFGADKVTYLNGPNMLKIYDGDAKEIEAIKKFISNKKIITSHFPYGLHNILQQEMKYVTFLRNPIDRVISQYNFMKTKIFDGKKILSIKEMLENGMLCSNLMTKQIAGLPPENVSFNEAELGPNCFYMNTVGFRFPREFWLYNDQLLPQQEEDNEELLHKAISNIDNDFLFAGTQENLKKDIYKLNDLLGIKNQENVQVINKSKNTCNIDSETKELIEKYNQLDIRLYEHIRTKN